MCESMKEERKATIRISTKKWRASCLRTLNTFSHIEFAGKRNLTTDDDIKANNFV